MPTRPLTRLLVTAVATACAVVLAGCGASSDHTGMSGMTHGSAGSGSPAASTTDGDVMFAQMMVPHHEQAVEMADLALQPRAGASAAVRRLATAIRAAQAPEIATMTGWLERWGAPTAGAMDHGMPGMMGEADLAALAAATGEDFDRRWLTMMVAHHEGAVTMAQDVLTSTSRPEVRDLARAVVSAQQREIATMRALLG